jgi:hypothetical protein
MGIIQSLNFDNKETKAVKQKIRELQDNFYLSFANFLRERIVRVVC